MVLKHYTKLTTARRKRVVATIPRWMHGPAMPSFMRTSCLCSSLAHSRLLQLLAFMVRQYCKKLDYGRFCRHGCIKVNHEAQYVCHLFMKGKCRYGAHCQRGLHCKPNKTTSTQPRGDGFRPYTTDTDEDKTLKQHLATLGLSPFCEELQDHDHKMVETIYKHLATRRHPDKNPNEESHARFIQLQIAKDYIIARLPYIHRMAKWISGCTHTLRAAIIGYTAMKYWLRSNEVLARQQSIIASAQCTYSYSTAKKYKKCLRVQAFDLYMLCCSCASYTAIQAITWCHCLVCAAW